MAGGRIDAAEVPELRAAFETLYQQRYGAGTCAPQAPLEIISFRAEAVRRPRSRAFAPLFAGKRGARRRPPARRSICAATAGSTPRSTT